MHSHTDQDDLITEILIKIAYEKDKPLETIKRSLLIQQNPAINRRFWEILDDSFPGHGYNYIGCCAKCGLLELREEPPE